MKKELHNSLDLLDDIKEINKMIKLHSSDADISDSDIMLSQYLYKKNSLLSNLSSELYKNINKLSLSEDNLSLEYIKINIKLLKEFNVNNDSIVIEHNINILIRGHEWLLQRIKEGEEESIESHILHEYLQFKIKEFYEIHYK